jgi:hypothetical protein
MIALICFVLTVLASPFKSNIRLEAENAVLRHQVIALRSVNRRDNRCRPDRRPCLARMSQHGSRNRRDSCAEGQRE